MKDWNVVVSVSEKGFSQAVNILKEFGPISIADMPFILAVNALVTS